MCETPLQRSHYELSCFSTWSLTVLKNVIYSFPLPPPSPPPQHISAWTTHLENEPQKGTNWLFNHSLWDNEPYARHLPVWHVCKCACINIKLKCKVRCLACVTCSCLYLFMCLWGCTRRSWNGIGLDGGGYYCRFPYRGQITETWARSNDHLQLGPA